MARGCGNEGVVGRNRNGNDGVGSGGVKMGLETGWMLTSDYERESDRDRYLFWVL